MLECYIDNISIIILHQDKTLFHSKIFILLSLVNPSVLVSCCYTERETKTNTRNLNTKDFEGCVSWISGCVGRRVSSPFPHLLKNDDVVSCCLELTAPCISFRVNGLPVQGMLENFSADGFLYPVVSFSAGVKSVVEICFCLTLLHGYILYSKLLGIFRNPVSFLK